MTSFPPPSNTTPAKPATATVIQFAVVLIALATPALIVLMLQRLVGLIAAREQWNAVGLDLIEPGTTPMELARGEFRTEFTVVLALPVVLLVLALISVLGLQLRRRWGRIFTAVWTGIMVLPLAAWAAGCVLLLLTTAEPTTETYYVGPIDPFTLNSVAGTTAFASALTALVLSCTRALRRWAPKSSQSSAAVVPATHPEPVDTQRGAVGSAEQRNSIRR